MEDQATTEMKETGGSRRRSVLVGLAVLLLALGGGTGAYFYGKSTGEDLDAARAEGTLAGNEEGAAAGTEEGYEQGFEEGRRDAYDGSFEKAYTAAYRKAFEDAGLEPPKRVKVPEE